MSVLSTPSNMPERSIDVQRVAFAGKMGSGKSFQANWAAKILREAYNHEVRILSLGTAIKKMAVVHDRLNSRSGYQAVGWVGRQIDPEVWVNCLRTELANIPATTSIFVDDVRYINEVVALKQLGFHVVLMETSFQTRFLRISERIKREEQSFAFTEVAQWFSHDSECQFDGVLDRPAFDEILTEDAMYADIHYSDVDDWQTRTR